MNPESLRALLERVRDGETSPDEALETLRLLPYEELGFATLDHHRALRRGFAEVVFCQGKTPAQVATIMERLAAHADAVLGTRATPEVFAAVHDAVPAARYHELARAITVQRDEGRPRRRPLRGSGRAARHAQRLLQRHRRGQHRQRVRRRPAGGHD